MQSDVIRLPVSCQVSWRSARSTLRDRELGVDAMADTPNKWPWKLSRLPHASDHVNLARYGLDIESRDFSVLVRYFQISNFCKRGCPRLALLSAAGLSTL